ncbi:MAG TPA: hypothetical protein VFO50_01630 [Candidatus Limnocylindrales bacterium]|nr:hypothetical protein [Candidatus Limnocylindrales bacterium]
MDQETEPGSEIVELPVGEDQRIVLYHVPDLGVEIEPDRILAMVAADAARRESDGWQIVSTSSMPTRHGGVMFGQNGSSFQTKVTVIVVYGQRG